MSHNRYSNSSLDRRAQSKKLEKYSNLKKTIFAMGGLASIAAIVGWDLHTRDNSNSSSVIPLGTPSVEVMHSTASECTEDILYTVEVNDTKSELAIKYHPDKFEKADMDQVIDLIINETAMDQGNPGRSIRPGDELVIQDPDCAKG